ncbi:unnamed protein product [Cuscuta epithymum]|uniref:HAT C-terminal dimerisation domain-containing protein n=1 Tax=Cuscuta epithymum TaxID=186058 RepID=A0AAV0E0C1_9ASTE|nr:unnamed protein product [Cuscuta epithymum]
MSDDGRKLEEGDSTHPECEVNEIDNVDSEEDDEYPESDGEEDDEHPESDDEEGVGSNMFEERPVYSPESLQRRISCFILTQNVTPHIVKNKDFRDMMTSQFPSLTLDHETTMKHCLTLFEESKTEVRRFLNSMGRLICLSVDVLTRYSRIDVGPDFICLSASFIDNEWKLRKWILRFKKYGNDDFDQFVVKALDDWNLNDDKVYTLTSRKVDAPGDYIQSTKSKLEGKNRLPYHSRIFSVRCCAEMFGLMAEDAFGEISDIIRMIEELSWPKSECMWHLTNSKLKNALELEALGEFNSELVTKNYSVPSAEQWEKVRIVYKLVELVHDVAKKIFEVKNSTANLFLYNFPQLRASLVLEASSPDAFTLKLAKKMLKRFDKYIKKNYLVLAIASVMDPRCKMQFIEDVSAKLEGIDGLPQASAVLETVRSIYEHNEAVKVNEETVKSDLDLYLEDPVLPQEEKFNVLKWWESEGVLKYPNTSEVAREVLAIPMSVASSFNAYYYLENRPPPDVSITTSGSQLMNAVACCRSWRPEKRLSAFEIKFLFHSAGVNIF